MLQAKAKGGLPPGYSTLETVLGTRGPQSSLGGCVDWCIHLGGWMCRCSKQPCTCCSVLAPRVVDCGKAGMVAPAWESPSCPKRVPCARRESPTCPGRESPTCLEREPHLPGESPTCLGRVPPTQREHHLSGESPTCPEGAPPACGESHLTGGNPTCPMPQTYVWLRGLGDSTAPQAGH